MKIGGYQKTTLIDYSGKVAATIFTVGCNFRCSFCHNPDLVWGGDGEFEVEKILQDIENRKDLLDGICLTGGEPTMQADLPEFIAELKKLGMAVKLDTNGTNYAMLKKLIDEKLIDYTAMDIKAPWVKYEQVTQMPVNIENVKKSATLLIAQGDKAEFRSTILPALHSAEDIVEMARQIKGAEKYYLQQFKPAEKLVNQKFTEERPFTQAEIKAIYEQIKPWFKKSRIR